MRHSTGNQTKAEAARFDKLKAMKCIACTLNGNRDGEEDHDTVPPEIHHMKSGNRRIGHMATLPLCYWHHHGLPYDGVPSAWFLANVGPSIDKHANAFRLQYGTEAELLETVNGMIANG